MAMLGNLKLSMGNQESIVPFALLGGAATGAILAVRLANRGYLFAAASEEKDGRKNLLNADGEFQNEAVQSCKRR